jgi:hypothetical protein
MYWIMIKSRNSLLVIVFLLVGIVSCEKGPTKAILNFKAVMSELNQKKFLLVGEYEIDSMSMIIEMITIGKMIPEEAFGIENPLDSAAYWENLGIISTSIYGPYSINLLEGTSETGIEIIDVEPGLYCSLDASMVKGTGDSICFYMGGKTLMNNQEINFEVKYSGGANFTLENPDGFEITQNTDTVIYVLTDLNSLFNSLDWSMADVDNDGVIRINNDLNSNLIQTTIQNFVNASKIGLDQDQDGQID